MNQYYDGFSTDRHGGGGVGRGGGRDRAQNESHGAPQPPAPTKPRRRRQFVFKCALVTGTPFYGYHAGKELFVKVYIYNPRHVSTMAKLLASGGIMNTVFQPLEARDQIVLVEPPYPPVFIVSGVCA